MRMKDIGRNDKSMKDTARNDKSMKDTGMNDKSMADMGMEETGTKSIGLIRPAVAADGEQVLALYKAVAAVPGGIARTPQEVSADYVAGFMGRARADGLEFVFEHDGRILGEIHAARPGIACFAHVLTDLTIAVAPQCQGQGAGRRLFEALLGEAMRALPEVTRVELFVRESNLRAQALYRSLGFVEEGRLRARVVNAHGVPEHDIIMGWLRPQAGSAQGSTAGSTAGST
ncbi:MAG: GNAT family N-acetyltransferase [Pseudomonadota bacterium]